MDQTSKSACVEFTDIVFNQSQLQFATKEVAIRTGEIFAKTGDRNFCGSGRHRHQRRHKKTTLPRRCSFGFRRDGQRGGNVTHGSRIVKLADSFGERFRIGCEPQSTGSKWIALYICPSGNHDDAPPTVQHGRQRVCVAGIAAAVVGEFQPRAKTVRHEGIGVD